MEQKTKNTRPTKAQVNALEKEINELKEKVEAIRLSYSLVEQERDLLHKENETLSEVANNLEAEITRLKKRNFVERLLNK